MPEIVLTEAQTKQLAGTATRVEVKDAFGRVVGFIDPLPSPEFIAEMKRRAAMPCRFDRATSRDRPDRVSGKHLSEGLWRLRVPPLVVHYTIDLTRRHVEVTHCARTA